jgi:hypothetical protein
VTDHAPWHRRQPIDEALADHPHRNAIEWFWRVLRRRATHNLLLDGSADLRRSIRNSLCDFPTVRRRVRGLVARSYTRPENRYASAGS